MVNDLRGLRELRLWHIAVGGAVLLVISLYQLYDVIGERRDRSDVVAHGRDAQARVVRATGIESVLIEWTDEGGRRLEAESRTGKVFARSNSGGTVAIKYDPASVRQPVILSEVPEREQVDAFWFRSSLFSHCRHCGSLCRCGLFDAARKAYASGRIAEIGRSAELWIDSRPHPEEPCAAAILRDARKRRAPQDEADA